MLTLQIFFSTTLYHVTSKNEPSMKITIIAEIIFRPKHNLIFTTHAKSEASCKLLVYSQNLFFHY